MIALAVDLFSLNGEMKAVITTCPVSTNILVISATRLMFSIRSLFEKPRSLLMPNLVLSPSNTIEWIPLSKSFLCSAFARVDFPEPESPVNHKAIPRCLFRSSKSLRPIC